MSEERLHPQVEQFKAFLTKRPAVIEAGRKSGEGFQDLFEKWSLLGEEDPYWKQFESSQKKATPTKETDTKSFLDHVLGFAKKTDVSEISKHAGTLSETITSLQEMLALFQKEGNSPKPTQDKNDNLFHVFKD